MLGKQSSVIPSVHSKAIDTSMISLPRGDLRHIGHIGFDGVVSGKVDFIAPGVERVSIGSPTNGKQPKQMPQINSTKIKRADSFGDDFELPDLSIESEVEALISNIRLSKYLIEESSPTKIQTPPIYHRQAAPIRISSPSTKVVSASESLSVTPGLHSASGSPTIPNITSDTTSSPPSTNDEDPIAELTKPTATDNIQPSSCSWRYVDSPTSDSKPSSCGEEEISVNFTSSPKLSMSPNASNNFPGPRRVSIVTAEDRQSVYDEIRKRCGHPLLLSDCLRAVSYTQGNLESAVKFLKLQYLASHRVAEVEKCKNALVACDWEIEKALDMLRLGDSSANHTNSGVNGSQSDAVNV